MARNPFFSIYPIVHTPFMTGHIQLYLLIFSSPPQGAQQLRDGGKSFRDRRGNCPKKPRNSALRDEPQADGNFL
jgi:hypothetical protein